LVQNFSIAFESDSSLNLR